METRSRENHMMDIVYVGTFAVFFGIAWGFYRLMEKL
jgi:hypothetical protein